MIPNNVVPTAPSVSSGPLHSVTASAISIISNQMEDFNFFSETGESLFKRLRIQPCKLVEEVPQGLRPGNIVEISGNSGSGKTEKTLEIVIKCICPKMWEGMKMDGEEARAIFYDHDFTFHPLRIIQKLEHLFETKYHFERQKEMEMESNESVSSKKIFTMNDVELGSSKSEFIKVCLQKLFVIRCKDEYEFYTSLQILPKLLKDFESSLHPIKLMVVDSLTAFYWLNKNEDTQGKNIQKLVITSIFNLIHTYNLILVVTKPILFRSSKGGEESLLGKQWSDMVNYRVLCKKETK